MILQIPQLVRKLLPERFGDKSISVALIQCTHPVYLAFTDDPVAPACVLKMLPGNQAETQYETLAALHAMLPSFIPEPLSYSRLTDDRSVLVQAGVPGVPWFRLADRFRTRVEWISLRQRAIDALRAFQTAVRSRPEWQGTICPGRALRQLIDSLRMRSVKLPSRVLDYIEASTATLDELGTLSSFWQHGDYCLNNLIISKSGVALIDFDDFGTTCMPLHDEFGLALSIYQHTENLGSWGSLRDDIAACLTCCKSAVDPALKPEHVMGLLVHHLIWRIADSLGVAKRARQRTWLIGLLEDTVNSPNKYIFDVAPGL